MKRRLLADAMLDKAVPIAGSVATSPGGHR